MDGFIHRRGPERVGYQPPTPRGEGVLQSGICLILLTLVAFTLGGCLSYDLVRLDGQQQDAAERLYQRLVAAKLTTGMSPAEVVSALARAFRIDDVISWLGDGRRVDQADGVVETHHGLSDGDTLSILADQHGVVVSVRIQHGSEGAEMILAPEPPREVLDAIPSLWPNLASASDISGVLSMLGLTDYIHYLQLTESVDMSRASSSVRTFLSHYSVPGYRLSVRRQHNGLLVVVFSSPQSALGWALAPGSGGSRGEDSGSLEEDRGQTKR